jgi:hypothetical protein
LDLENVVGRVVLRFIQEEHCHFQVPRTRHECHLTPALEAERVTLQHTLREFEAYSAVACAVFALKLFNLRKFYQARVDGVDCGDKFEGRARCRAETASALF